MIPYIGVQFFVGRVLTKGMIDGVEPHKVRNFQNFHRLFATMQWNKLLRWPYRGRSQTEQVCGT